MMGVIFTTFIIEQTMALKGRIIFLNFLHNVNFLLTTLHLVNVKGAIGH